MGDSEFCSDFDNLEIETRHKKERKELQAQIQSLKKNAGKKKKKEVLDEIARLEFELDRKHEEELSRIDLKKPKETEEPEDEKEDENRTNNEPRISKAQKRRDKKAAEEKIRQAEIAAAEIENKNGPRIKEMQSIQAILTERNLALHTIASDGDCLYNAIRNQLRLLGRTVPDVIELRQQTADYILRNKDSLIFYMTNPDTGDCLNDEEFIKYCGSVRNTPAWGGQIEITALSNILKSTIEVIQSSGPPTIQGESNGPNLIITYHRHMYSLGEHYNGTKPLNS